MMRSRVCNSAHVNLFDFEKELAQRPADGDTEAPVPLYVCRASDSWWKGFARKADLGDRFRPKRLAAANAADVQMGESLGFGLG